MYIKSKNSYYNPYLPIYYREYGAQLECDFGDQLEFDKKKQSLAECGLGPYVCRYMRVSRTTDGRRSALDD